MTDGILLAETQGDRDARRLRHDHHRRGARAQPQHRFPARLPEAAAAAAARSQADRHVGDARRGALRAPFRRRRRAGAGDRGVGPHAIRSKCAIARSAAARPTRPTTRRSSRRRSSPRPRTCGAKVRATSWCSCRASARSARPSDLLRAKPRAAAVRAQPWRSCRCTRACRSTEQQRVFAPQRRPPHRARDQRRRDVADGARASAT